MYYVTLKRTVIDFSIYLFVCLSFLIFVFLLTLPSYYNYIHVLNTNTLRIIYIYIHTCCSCMLRWALPGGASTAAYPRHGKAHGGQIGGRRWSRFTHESSIVTRQKIWPRDQRARKSSKDGCHVYEQKSHQRTYSNFLGPIARIFGIVQICALMCYDVLCHNASCGKLAH